MPIVDSTLAPASATFAANREHMLGLLQQVRACEQRTHAKSAASRERFEQRGQLLPRDRLALLLDPGAPFLELATLAGLGLDTPDLARSVPGGGVIAGIGFVSGVRCMVLVSDAGIDAGALQPMGLDKIAAGAGTRAGQQAALRAAGRVAPAPTCWPTGWRTSSAAAAPSATWRACRPPGCRW